MTPDSLLGHIAMRFSSHPENVATESLAYILRRSPSAKRAFLGFIRYLGTNTASGLVFNSQDVGEDGSIPDLVASDTEGREIVILEAKFWAGLTDNQPVSYLKRLPSGQDAILVFVAPALRLTLLWNELVQRCLEANTPLADEKRHSSEAVVRAIGAHHRLALVSWRALLTHLNNEINSEGDLATVSDVRQLQGLCDRMDEDAFLPLRSDELAPSIPIRHIQLCRLVDDVANQVIAEKLASFVEGSRISYGVGIYKRPLRLLGFGCVLQVNSDHWAWRRETPIWLSIQDSQWKLSQIVKDTLAPLAIEDPPRVIYSDSEALVPLRLPVGVERSTVVEVLVDQIRTVVSLLGRSAGAHVVE
jgi:hypothetical protein